MKQSRRGFTLVELILAISMLGIISTIGIVGWGSLTKNMRDKGRETDTRAWIANFETYKGRFFVYPTLPSADGVVGATTVCLGTFAKFSNKCGQYVSAAPTAYVSASGSSTTSMLDEIKKVGNAPANNSTEIGNAIVGPIAYSTQSTASGTTTVTTQFINFFENNCPTDFTNINTSLPASITLALTGLPGGATANACSISKTYSYTP